ncbi:assembly protein [Vibrio sinensis]|uniref:Assembly protein n=1 Tax=Vibrio sinensis TaxID=2302434 RepID=A0A3A6QNG7_9VIBR|nr:zonular occludens toxin domain-containing protein [Vibrio sinensis]RJX72808.1 assembly protein [Vibrio sinensis]
MINALTGRPGGGKSYEAVAFHIIPAIKDGRRVITNVALNRDHFRKIFGDIVDELLITIDGKLNDFGNVERPFSKLSDYQDDWRNDKGQAPLYVIDEAHLALPARGCAVDVLEWYSMHRHYGADLLLMTQNLRKIHRDIKDMIEVHYYCVKNTALGSTKSYTRKVRNGSGGEVLNENVRKYESAYFKFYQSHTGSNKAVEEAMAKDVKPLWKHWTVWVSAICLLGGPIYLISSGGIFGGVAPEETEQSEPVPVDAPATNIEVSTPAYAPKPKVADPLSSYKLYASGEVIQAAFDDKKRLIRGNTFSKVYIDVFENDMKLFTTNSLDLIDMGYTFKQMTECIYQLTYEGSSRFVVCGDYEKQVDEKELFAANPIASF